MTAAAVVLCVFWSWPKDNCPVVDWLKSRNVRRKSLIVKQTYMFVPYQALLLVDYFGTSLVVSWLKKQRDTRPCLEQLSKAAVTKHQSGHMWCAWKPHQNQVAFFFTVAFELFLPSCYDGEPRYCFGHDRSRLTPLWTCIHWFWTASSPWRSQETFHSIPRRKQIEFRTCTLPGLIEAPYEPKESHLLVS